MMKYLFLLLVTFCFLGSPNAQDLITLKNGNQINGRVLEITPTAVKMKKTSDGPLYTLNLSDISTITYQNGTVEKFGPEPAAMTSPIQIPIKKKEKDLEDETLIPVKKYSGPRVGCTYISAGTSRTRIAEAFDRADITPFISQFGWQFETRLFTLDNGAAGLVEFIPMLGGLEQGLFLPSASAIIGFRTAKGLEFGVGPTVSLSGFGLVMVTGASFKVGKITFPLNIAFTPNIKKMIPDEMVYNPNTGQYDLVPGYLSNSGFRLSFLIGFNSRKE